MPLLQVAQRFEFADKVSSREADIAQQVFVSPLPRASKVLFPRLLPCSPISGTGESTLLLALVSQFAALVAQFAALVAALAQIEANS